MTFKICFKCQLEKPLTEFYKHKQMADGHLNKCKICAKNDVSKHRLENIDSIRQYDRQRGKLKNRREKAALLISKWRLENPQRRAAHIAVGNAVRDGRLIPWPCMLCGNKAEAHHPDYSRPLDVVWLCPPHHKQAHAMVKK